MGQFNCYNIGTSHNRVEKTNLLVKLFDDCPALEIRGDTLKDQLFLRMTDEDWHHVLNVNLHGTFYCTRAVIKGMAGKREAGRRIINITSIAGETGNVGQANYAASKAALIGLTKSLARELVSMKVTVNAVAPGFIATEFVSSLPTEQLEKKIPLRRLGVPEEVASVVSLLASDEGEYITGEVVRINGGLLM